MEQTEAGIQRDQKVCRLLITVEPTAEELDKWPFLRCHGGIGTVGRHPIFIHFCDVFTMYKLWARRLSELEKNKENVKNYQYVHMEAYKKVNDALKALQSLKWFKEGDNPGLIYMDDLMQTGRYYKFPSIEKSTDSNS